MLVTVKLERSLPADPNSADLIEQRFDYALWFVNKGVASHCHFIDECGYNIWISRSCGRPVLESELTAKLTVNVDETLRFAWQNHKQMVWSNTQQCRVE